MPAYQQPVGTTLCTYSGHPGLVGTLAWSPTGKNIASITSSTNIDRTVHVWETTKGKLLFQYRGHPYGATDRAWSPDGACIASVSGNVIQIWNAVRGRKLLTLINSSEGLTQSIAWSPDSKFIATGGALLHSTVSVWNATTRSLIFTTKSHYASVKAIAWSADGRYIVSVSDWGVHICNAATGNHIFTCSPSFGGKAEDIAWSPNGHLIAIAANSTSLEHCGIVIWDITARKEILIYAGHSAPVIAVSWSPDGQYIASGGNDQTVQIWYAMSGNNAFTYRSHTDVVRAVAWSPDGSRIASGSWDGTVHVWQAKP